ncbi:hypothetical protein ACSQ67_020073 [Phaseolus vulgaris]
MVAMASTANRRIETYEEFAKVHALLLAASGLPECLHRRLFEKLSGESFDGGSHFQIEPCEGGRQRRLVLTSTSMETDSDVFLVDHAWTFRLSDAYKQVLLLHLLLLKTPCFRVPGLAERMGSLMCVDVDVDDDEDEGNCELGVEETLESEVGEAKEKGDGTLRWLELEGLNIDDAMLVSLALPTRFPDLVALSLLGNKLNSAEVVVQEVIKFKHLKGIWLNNNPVLKNCDGKLEGVILKELPELEIYNSSFTSNFGEWALGFCAGIYGKDNPVNADQAHTSLHTVSSLDLSNRNIHNLKNKAFTPICLPSLTYLNIQGNPLDQNSVSDLLDLLRRFTCLRSLEVDIPGPLGRRASDILESLPNISELNGINASKILETGKHVIGSMLLPRLPEWTPDEPLADRIINAMWQYLMTYRLADEEKLDETSVWYVMDELGSALRHSDEPNFRVAPFLFMPEGNLASAVSFSILWPTQNVQKGDECTRNFLLGIGEDKQRSARLTAWFHTPENYFINAYEKHQQKLLTTSLVSPTFQYSETGSIHQNCGRPLRVYTDIPHVEEYLTHPEFAITNEPKGADIIWTGMQVDEEMKKATGITDQQYINQFPFEACLVMKHHLAETIQKAHGSPQWLQPTYNLETHLSQLIGDYCVRRKEGLDNLWILKPWNMARTIDTTVRIANNLYSLARSSLFEYETHFTVMNYRGAINHKNASEFVREFEEEHQVKWLDIHTRVRKMIRSVFEAAAVAHPEMHSPTSRAMYGVDVMLDSSFQPKLLEVTYCPDCTRACKYDMDIVVGEGGVAKGVDFFNNVFRCLFLNETSQVSQL